MSRARWFLNFTLLVLVVALVVTVLVVWVFPPGHSAEVRNSTPDFVVLATSGGQVRALDPGAATHGGGVWLVSIGNRCTWHDAGSTVEHRTGSNDRDTWTRYANSARVVVDSCWTATWR